MTKARTNRRLAAAGGAVLLFAAFGADTAASADRFERWLMGVRREARARGVKPATLDAALTGVRPDPKVIRLLKHQPEFKLTLDRYLAIVVSPSRIAQGRVRYVKHRAELARASAAYGVSPQFLVALWGTETRYGKIMGSFKVVNALSTLAYQGSRRRYFRSELINALRILDQGHITHDRMYGSWAGAMGQCQFMPSSFLNFAVDGNGDGRRDIWGTLPDVFASSGNYLKRNGWRRGQTWGREVRLPRNFRYGLARARTPLSLAAWTKLGVRRIDGGPLPRANIRGRILLPEGRKGRAFLVYHNFRVIKRWNNSNFFAIAVGQLADRIAAAPARKAKPKAKP